MKPDFEKMATDMISAANPQLRVTVAAALRAAYAAGLVVVPKEPTEEMSEAGHEAVCDDHDQDGVFRYMLAASPYAKKGVTL